MNTQEPPAKSSNIVSIGYDDDFNTMYVTFKNGYRYAFFNVPEDRHDEMLNSASVGSYFNKNIRNRYTQEKLP